jgi:hypothetical protein
MFKSNKKHNVTSLWGIQNSLPERLHKKLMNSSQYYFYKIIFCNIQEEDFRVLYSDKVSRPNAPVNCMVSALILKQKYNWSYEELFEQIEFNILTKTALGLDSIDDIPFDDATLFNFQNRIKDYYVATGINLLEQVFDKLTEDQLKKLKLKTDIQRTDSLMANSNIRQYSRLQLLIEVLLRLWRILDESDKLTFGSMFSNYTNKSSGQYLYKLQNSDLPHELEKIAALYHYCHENLIPKYKSQDFIKIFERVYNEHFTLVEEQIALKPSSELKSSYLQSPDDWDATFRVKRSEEYQGQSINIVETAHPDNPLNLLTDVSVNPNNADDSNVLNERIDKVMYKTPDMNELHSDGAYGNTENDKKFEESDIIHIQTAVRGRQCEVDIVIEQKSENSCAVTCPLQSAESELSGNRFKAMFDSRICANCEFAGTCPTKELKNSRTYYFKKEDYLRNKRIREILKIPIERRKIRPNVEASVHEFSCRLTNGKLKVRGSFKTEVFAFTTAIAINFGRIFRNKSLRPLLINDFCLNFAQKAKYNLILLTKLQFVNLNRNYSYLLENFSINFQF